MPKISDSEIEISVIIVTWNSSSEIGNCLWSVAECSEQSGSAGDLKLEVIIIDNASGDNTVEIIRKFITGSKLEIKLIENKKNQGFTAANNQGFGIAGGKYTFLLNPDTILKKNSLNLLIEFLNANEKTAAAAPRLLNSDGSIQLSCRTFPHYRDMFCELTLLSKLFPKSKVFSRWKMKYFSHNELRKVDQPMAAALMIRSDVLKEVNCFDHRFNMFFNDVDLCRKIYDASYEIYFIPAAEVFHIKGASIYKDRKRMIKLWNQDCLKYFRKYHYNFFLYNSLEAGLSVSGFFRGIFSSS